ncbi:MAG: hypothetical protein A2268_16545 [Candidatus Raymondbacteria bacterium RifOxyA12_full_50_37]|uniref:Methyltransferase domain-containing protein n=1 Tax=Candidatus Raymondbacteria bacterium RIFOXYD12_FULL_49_13 TaxID=1817890 RepID=A0A1F7F482_UNCRA|nr:MAG: hypothetical protein A2268_16545 [Candidatus Raymondbacteria bacterium RifOxyA12_full_50_37]OGJ86221.1 MAG: hypothetical protein A2248_16135 [Candidatus Raymondbacteria bacterium RIFOXYA2_FULL_49_16]OGJ95759.1 MAG: hypothetical protein A2453_11455 [Candidatus Raymondbacteria bacterium RIFOXYC2_FULL_50_21]OGJ95981.1 MAG: hypothetical protein A2350_15885 [Candidatus Raymondbacteria bacterium RifOxyB12_full_50_8]OGK01480.1 MAG: hypothetical protein A2519_19350 [Candidatus Raymondbacteria b
MEKFYSTGFTIGRFKNITRKKRTEEFLSFGYWEKNTKTYLDAANNLLHYFVEKSGIGRTQKILSVACGYGTETFAVYDAFKPDRIEAIDVTEKHVQYANGKAATLNLADKIRFSHGDACKLDYPVAAFSLVLGIEGPVHFNTREAFFGSAYQVLGNNGNLLLMDIITGEKFAKATWLQRKILAFTVKRWVVPKANWVDQATYRQQLSKAGFTTRFITPIGDKVFPGYAKNGLSLRTIWIRMFQRGPGPTVGLTIISYLLGYLYKRGLIEYIYVKATKEPDSMPGLVPLPAAL